LSHFESELKIIQTINKRNNDNTTIMEKEYRVTVCKTKGQKGEELTRVNDLVRNECAESPRYAVW
jgi:hypothetical protein